uniref:Uncharacterized protein n=1 Tax=Opuntia streptacantha TaxID=393608 RepID=A0A7C8YXL9_OPUST
MTSASPAAVLTKSHSFGMPLLKKICSNSLRIPPVRSIFCVASSSIAKLVSISIASFCSFGCFSPCCNIPLMLMIAKTFSDISFRSCFPVFPVELASFLITCSDLFTM